MKPSVIIEMSLGASARFSFFFQPPKVLLLRSPPRLQEAAVDAIITGKRKAILLTSQLGEAIRTTRIPLKMLVTIPRGNIMSCGNNAEMMFLKLVLKPMYWETLGGP